MAAVNPPAPPPQIEVNPGYKTTEFWQSLLTQIVAAFGANRQYLVSRTDVKTATANANAAIAQASMGLPATPPVPGP
jgi:hypothetical protein